MEDAKFYLVIAYRLITRLSLQTLAHVKGVPMDIFCYLEAATLVPAVSSM
jgi:hypothetical protein